MPHFLETLYGTKHPSFVIGKSLTTQGTVYGPTIFQGGTPPDPTVDSIVGTANPGDLWIQTGPSPSINQYIANTWVAVLSSATSGVASVAYVDTQIANASAALVGLADILVVNSIANVVAGLAVSTETLALNSIANVIGGLATIQDVDGRFNTFTTTLTQISSEFIATSVANAVSGLASTQYVDDQIGNIANTLDTIANTIANDTGVNDPLASVRLVSSFTPVSTTLTDGTIETLFSYTLSANTLDTTGMALRITYIGTCEFGTDFAHQSIWFNFGSTSTLVPVGCDVMYPTFTHQWLIGRTGSNNQQLSYLPYINMMGGGAGTTALTETDTSPIIISVTAQASAGLGITLNNILIELIR